MDNELSIMDTETLKGMLDGYKDLYHEAKEDAQFYYQWVELFQAEYDRRLAG